jgi:hypothetical protein
VVGDDRRVDGVHVLAAAELVVVPVEKDVGSGAHAIVLPALLGIRVGEVSGDVEVGVDELGAFVFILELA